MCAYNNVLFLYKKLSTPNLMDDNVKLCQTQTHCKSTQFNIGLLITKSELTITKLLFAVDAITNSRMDQESYVRPSTELE